MIINGGSRSNWRFFAKHLVKTEENEQVRIAEIRGLASDNILGAFREMHALAGATACKNFFYHANINPREDEVLTPQQWDEAVDTLEKKLGLTDHSRFIVEHEKEGRCHRHVIWSRINTDSMTAVSDSNNYAAHERASRELEKRFGQTTVIGAHGKDGARPKRRPKNWETFRGLESGVDPAAFGRQVTALWHQADSGKAFVASLQDHGYQLCRGDRRDFCLIDAAGDVHSLARRIDGATAAQIRERMVDVDRDSLPTIAKAQANPVAAKSVEPVAEMAPSAATLQPDPLLELLMDTPLSPLDAFAAEVTGVMVENDGEPVFIDGLTWLERTVTILEAAIETAGDWIRGRWQDLVDRFGSGEDGPDIEQDHER